MSALLEDIERYLRRTNTSAARLGREAVGCPKIVSDMRAGRTLGQVRAARLRHTMRSHPDGLKTIRPPLPVPAVARIREASSPIAAAIEAEAKRRGEGVADFLQRLVMLGWQRHREGQGA